MRKVVGVLAVAAVAAFGAGIWLAAAGGSTSSSRGPVALQHRSSTMPSRMAGGATVRRVVVERVLQLPAGDVQRAFRFVLRAMYADHVQLVVTPGAAVSALARSADGLMGIGAATRPWRENCRRAGPVDVCDQPQEWCPLSDRRWRVVVRKSSTKPARVRVRFVFVRKRAASATPA